MADYPKLYDLLKAFSNEEFINCHQYLLNRLEKGSQLEQLASFICSNRENLPSLLSIQQERFPNLNKKAISNKISILKSYIESFLIRNYQNNRKIISQYNLFLAYHERALYKEAARQRQKVEKICVDNIEVDLNCLLILHKLQHNLFYSHAADKDKKGPLLLLESTNYISTYQHLTILQYRIESLVRSDYYKDDPFVSSQLESQNSIGTLGKVLECLSYLLDQKKQSTKKYQFILNYINGGTDKQVGDIYTFILVHFIHYKIYLLKKKNIAVDDDLLHLYECGLKTGAFTQRKYISPRRFNNIINAGCSFQRLDWAKKILKDHGKELLPLERKETVLMAKAQILQAEGHHKKALDILGPNQWTSIDNKLRYRWLTAICLLEINSVYRVDTHLTAFNNYLKSPGKKFTKSTIEASLNFIKIVRMFRRNLAIEKIRTRYRDMNLVANRSWIEQKLKGPSQK